MSYPSCIAIFFITYLVICFAQGSGTDAGESNKVLTKIEDSQKNMTKLLHKIYQKLDPDYQNGIIKDVALGKGKHTTLSSIGDPLYYSDKAVDGNLNTFFFTSHQYKPYFTVDLGKTYKIKRIEIFNRRDCCGERLHDVNIYVGKSHNDMELCNHYTGPSRTQDHLIFNCVQQLRGRYVKIIIIGTEYLQLAEVKVYALVK